MDDTERTLHVAVDRAYRTWRILEREDGTFSVYYTNADNLAHHVVYDSDPTNAVDSARQYAELRRLALALCDSEIAYSTHTSTISRAALLALRAAVEN